MEHSAVTRDIYAQESKGNYSLTHARTHSNTHLPVEEQEKCVARTKKQNYERIKQFSFYLFYGNSGQQPALTTTTTTTATITDATSNVEFHVCYVFCI